MSLCHGGVFINTFCNFPTAVHMRALTPAPWESGKHWVVKLSMSHDPRGGFPSHLRGTRGQPLKTPGFKLGFQSSYLTSSEPQMSPPVPTLEPQPPSQNLGNVGVSLGFPALAFSCLFPILRLFLSFECDSSLLGGGTVFCSARPCPSTWSALLLEALFSSVHLPFAWFQQRHRHVSKGP